jgi:hypothetical protein
MAIFIILKGEKAYRKLHEIRRKLAQILRRLYNKPIHSFDLIDRIGKYRILTESVINSFTLYMYCQQCETYAVMISELSENSRRVDLENRIELDRAIPFVGLYFPLSTNKAQFVLVILKGSRNPSLDSMLGFDSSDLKTTSLYHETL